MFEVGISMDSKCVLFFYRSVFFYEIDKYLKTQFFCRIRTLFQKENSKKLRMNPQK